MRHQDLVITLIAIAAITFTLWSPARWRDCRHSP
jgi:hypothetical protein